MFTNRLLLAMKLRAFRVTQFRSVQDSGWVDVDNLTALIGANESGKTNLLLPLWKLNPASDGQINLLADIPRHRYHELRNQSQKPVFIRARFELPKGVAEQIAEQVHFLPEHVRLVEVSCDYDGKHTVSFPEASVSRNVPAEEMQEVLDRGIEDIADLQAINEHHGRVKERVIGALQEARQGLVAGCTVNRDEVSAIREKAGTVKTGNTSRDSVIVPRYKQVLRELEDIRLRLNQPLPGEHAEVQDRVLKMLPAFVYYSNYGNLDAEIYLPHVIDNMRRDDLGRKERAKARTLKVLFEFVGLDPQEIKELGQDFAQQYARRREPAPQPSEQDIEKYAERKREREVLLQSASNDITKKFREWWKQGNYKFRFQADGDHFRIWVSDEIRPEEVELEGRSAGLQWFFSFYLTFLVESEDAHKDAILLLDEPGRSLHPVAQRDLSDFFDSLSSTNQLLYTTHSPFMVNADHLDRVRVVYVNEDGKTDVSPDLRASQKQEDQATSVYLINAALGISASEGLLYGAHIVVVEGTSDQIYLSAIKNYLIGQGMISPYREITFVPGGGTRGIKSVAGIFMGRNGEPPHVLLDADQPGKQLASHLRSHEFYASHSERIVVLDEILDLNGAEIEDLWPQDELARVISRYFRHTDTYFDDVVTVDKPIMRQVDSFAQKHDVELANGFKVEIAQQAKKRLLNDPYIVSPESSQAKRWKSLFEKILGSTFGEGQ